MSARADKIWTFLNTYFTGTFNEITDFFFAGNYVYLLIFAAAIVMLIIFRKEFDKGYKLLIPFCLTGMVLILYNPLVKVVFEKLPAVEEGNVYARLWLLFPVWIVIAYTVVCVCMRISNKVLKCAFIAAVAAALIFSGNTIMKQQKMLDAQSIYKIKPEAVQIADEVLRLNGNEPTVLYIFVPQSDTSERYVNGGTLAEGIRQYSGNILLYPSYCTAEDLQQGGYLSSEIGIIWLFDYAKNADCDFIAYPDTDYFVENIRLQGHEPESYAGGYVIYRINR